MSIDNVAIFSLQAGLTLGELRRFVKTNFGFDFKPEDWRLIKEIRRHVRQECRRLGFKLN